MGSNKLVRLSEGYTYFEIGGHGNNCVVLTHGFFVPSFIYDPTFKFLSNSGFRVLRYDLFGRGFSEKPHTRYNIDLFVNQLLDLLDALGFTGSVHLIGLSMGGSITTVFTQRYSDRVKSLTLIDPSGASSVPLTPLLNLVRIPFIPEAVLSLIGTEKIIKAVANYKFDPNLVKLFSNKCKMQMQYNGFKRAILSSIRNNMLGSFIKSYQTVGNSDVPVLLIWGRDDKAVPIEHSDDLLAAMTKAKFHILENCGHIPHYEKPDEFNAILLEFLESCHYC